MFDKISDALKFLGFDYCQKPGQRKNQFSPPKVILVTKEKGCLVAAFSCLCIQHYFFAGAAGVGVPGLGALVPSTGSTLISSTSKMSVELPGILF